MNHPLATREVRTAFNYELRAKGIAKKVCACCLETKPHADFGRMRSSSDGLQPSCRSCKAARHAERYYSDPAYREKHNSSSINWSKSHRERVKERVGARKAATRVRNASKVQDPNVFKHCRGRCGQLLPETAFRLDRGQPDGLRRTCRSCTTKCRHICRRAHGAPEGQTCYLCGESIRRARDAWVDHVVPRSKGGGDEPENLRWTHGECNNRRSNQPLTAEQIGRLGRTMSASECLGTKLAAQASEEAGSLSAVPHIEREAAERPPEGLSGRRTPVCESWATSGGVSGAPGAVSAIRGAA